MTARGQTPAVLLFAGLALFPFAARFGAEAYLLTLGARMLILALAALSLDFLVGQAALVSFGHAAYLGIGAYAVVLASMAGIDDLVVQALIAVAAAALFAALTGYVSLRASGVYYIMSTLAFGQMLYFLFVSLSALGGDDGYTLSNRSRLFGEPRLTSDFSFYYLCLAALALAYLLLARIAGSRFGRVLNAIRQNPLRARALGFRPFAFQLAACVIAGAIAAIAGTLLANQSEFVAPAFMSWQRSGELLVMTILGGVGSLWGAVLGAIVYLTLEEALSLVTDQTHVLIGPLLVVVAIFGRRGLAGALDAQNLGRRGVSPPLLRVEGLAKSFGALAVTDDVSFSVNEGASRRADRPQRGRQDDADRPTLRRPATRRGTDPCSRASTYRRSTCPRAPGLDLCDRSRSPPCLPEYSALENVALGGAGALRFELPLLWHAPRGRKS